MFFHRYTLVESKTRTFNGRVEAKRRTAGQRDSAAVGRDADGSVRPEDSHPLCPPASEESKTTVLNDPSGARTKDIFCKPMEEYNNRLTRGVFAVYRRNNERSSFLAADQCTVAPCLCKPFSCKACSGNTYIRIRLFVLPKRHS